MPSYFWLPGYDSLHRIRSPGLSVAFTVLLSLATIIALVGCSSNSPSRRAEVDGLQIMDSPASSEVYLMSNQEPESLSPRGVSGLSASRSSPSMAKSKSGSFSQGYAQAPPAQYEPRAPAIKPSGKRMVHYSGQADLRSTEPEKVLDSAVAVVESAGGYLEQRAGLFVALRVPADQFDSLFQRLMRLAEVVSYSQNAEDVGEAMQDLEMRLKVVTATLERLEGLVQKAKTENQKLRLLKELKRLREEKEVLESGRAELTQKAKFASIQIRMQTHTPVGDGLDHADLADFLWIGKLNPFNESRFSGRSKSQFDVPDGMVKTGTFRKPWRATSAQGSEFWGTELGVGPIGDSRFWAEAIRFRLRDGFKSADTSAVGAYRFCKFQSYGPTPYFYWVGVRATGDNLELAEFYFPNPDQQNKLLPGILAAVERKSK